jgi:predicted amidohydrolase
MRLATFLLAAMLSAQTRDQLRLGLFTAVPVEWDLEANWRTFERTAMEHAQDKPDLVITPECYLDGYVAAAKDWDARRFAAIAQDVEASSYIARLRELARTLQAYMILGFTEKRAGKLYDSAILVDRRGATVGVYHKTHLQNHDLRFSPGDDLPVFDTEWGKVGMLICADRRWPETARVLRLKGARITLIPSDGMWHLDNEWWMRTRSYENENFLAFTHPRVAFVTDPRGQLSAKLQTNVPAMLIADVDLSGVRNVDIRDRRPELYEQIARPR